MRVHLVISQCELGYIWTSGVSGESISRVNFMESLADIWSSVLSWLPSRDTAETLVALALLFVTTYLWRATVSLADTTRKRREDELRPKVVAKLRPWEGQHFSMELVLCNVGQGPALDTSFVLKGDWADIEEHGVFLKDKVVPLGFLAPGETDSLLFGVSGDIMGKGGKTPLKPFSVVATYTDISGGEHEKETLLDVANTERWFTDTAEYRKVKALQKIVDQLKPISKYYGTPKKF